MGRRKIEIVKVKDMNTRQITFSKRRTGLFKKASELSIMCGAKIAVVVFSPGNKPYSFAHPGVHDVAAEFLQQEFTSNELQRDPSYVAAEFLQQEFTSTELQRDPSSDVANIQQFSLQLADLMRELDEEEKKSAVLGEAIDQCQVNKLSELEKSHASLAEFNSKVKSDIEAAETMILFSHQGVEFPVARKKNK